MERSRESRNGTAGVGSWRVRRRWWNILIDRLLAGVAGGNILAEVGGFVHVDPETIQIDTVLRVEVCLNLTSPPLLCVGREPIGPCDFTGPLYAK